tara:strand:+ start:26 stop:382 length:357 start_codon:yes stop_codon:yes gene_type:complete
MNVFQSSGVGKQAFARVQKVRNPSPQKEKSDLGPASKAERPSEAEIRERIKELQAKKKGGYPEKVTKNTNDDDHPGNLSNDPRKAETRGKLIDALNDGSFPFSPKEQKVLNEILSKDK